MSRKATPQVPEANAAIQKIGLHCNHAKTNINALADEAEVCQSSLWRFMNGERKTITDAALKTLEYIDNWHNQHNHDKYPKNSNNPDHGYHLIESAVKSLWDGNPNTAEFIASLIKALGPALDVMSSSSQSGFQRSGVNEMPDILLQQQEKNAKET